jgi:FkbM family methyltransferase
MREAAKNILRRGRWFIRSVAGKDTFHRAQTKRPVTFLGGRPDTGFGAWGTYVAPLHADSIIYSVGVGDDISFDLALIERLGATVHAFDPTPQSHAWLSRQALPEQFQLHKYAVGDRDGTAAFYAHENPDWIAHSMLKTSHSVGDSVEVQVRRLKTLMELLGHERIDLLKIDIEGAEYGVIDDLTASHVRVGQLLVEFHHRFDEIDPESTQRAVRQLNEAGFESYYVSPNGEEYSFIHG